MCQREHDPAAACSAQVQPDQVAARSCLEQEAWLWQLASVLFSKLPGLTPQPQPRPQPGEMQQTCSGEWVGVRILLHHVLLPSWYSRLQVHCTMCLLWVCVLRLCFLSHLHSSSLSKSSAVGASEAVGMDIGAEPEAEQAEAPAQAATPAARLTQLRRCAALSTCLQVGLANVMDAVCCQLMLARSGPRLLCQCMPPTDSCISMA